MRSRPCCRWECLSTLLLPLLRVNKQFPVGPTLYKLSACQHYGVSLQTLLWSAMARRCVFRVVVRVCVFFRIDALRRVPPYFRGSLALFSVVRPGWTSRVGERRGGGGVDVLHLYAASSRRAESATDGRAAVPRAWRKSGERTRLAPATAT